MAVQTPLKTGYEKWQDGVNNAVGDAKWDIWDCDIQMAVNEYNRHLVGTAGYMPLDWQIIKAMLWVESGAANSEWNRKPMRIGVPGDAGLTSFLSGNEGGDLILPPAWKRQLTIGSIRAIPVHNIMAGVGYLLMKMAHYEYRSVPAADARIYEVVVKSGDSLEKIAKAYGSTPEMLRKLNPMASVLRPGQVLKLQKASVQRAIINWRPISTVLISQRYNGGRDPNYANKLDLTLKLIREKKVALCVK
jgi:hypothetical protein